MHQGHIYQIRKIKSLFQDSFIIVIMSGHFIQRGGVSVLDKWKRAEIAIHSGVNLVCELPVLYSTMPAEIYAKSAVTLIDNLKVSDTLFFSTESFNSNELLEIYYKSLENKKKIDELTQKYLKAGYSYPASFSSAKKSLNIPPINSSNDILGYEYIKALNLIKSNIKPITIRRIGSSYNSKEIKTGFPSATALRNEIKNKNYLEVIPYLTGNLDEIYLEKYSKIDDDFYDIIKYSLAEKIANNSLKSIFGIKEGLDKRLEKTYISSKNLNDLILETKSKRYTYNLIKRLLFANLLNITKDDFQIIKENNFSPPYLRLLAFDDKGREILTKIKKNSTIPIITKVANFTPTTPYSKKVFQKDIYSTTVYNILQLSEYSDDYKVSPIYVKK